MQATSSYTSSAESFRRPPWRADRETIGPSSPLCSTTMTYQAPSRLLAIIVQKWRSERRLKWNEYRAKRYALDHKAPMSACGYYPSLLRNKVYLIASLLRIVGRCVVKHMSYRHLTAGTLLATAIRFN